MKEKHIDKGKYTVKVYHRYLPKQLRDGLPMAQAVKNLSRNAVDLGLIPVGKIPWRRTWQPSPTLLPGEFMDREPAGQLRDTQENYM